MNKSPKIRVAVLYGGRSGEHEISLLSATSVIQNLDRQRFEVVPIGIDKQGSWFLGDDIIRKELSEPAILRLTRAAERQLFNPDLIGKSLQQVQSSALLPQLKHKERLFDVIFPVIHGPLCEDGSVQGLLELADIPYVGSGVLASAIGMDKDISKRLICNAGIKVPPFITIKRSAWDNNPAKFCESVTLALRYPVFVKPANTGSSVGVHKIKRPEDLSAAINNAFLYDTKVVIEQGINGIEIEVAVLESLDVGADPIVSVPGQVKPADIHEFYSYASKYLDENGAELIIPAPVTGPVEEKIRQVAKNIFTTLDCEGMARVDLFLERETNEIYFNEVNTIPGFTKISMYPKLMAATGIHYSELLTHLVMLAMARHTIKNQLSREYIPSSL